MEESYNKIMERCLLRRILGYLPYEDQLRMREVNKNWEDEACAALNNSKLYTMVFQKDKVAKFLALFCLPPTQTSEALPMKLLSLAKVTIYPEVIYSRLLRPMAIQLGQSIRFLKISFSYLENAGRFRNLCESILSNCVQLQELRICRVSNSNQHVGIEDLRQMIRDGVAQRYPMIFNPTDGADDNPDPIELPQFQHLLKLTMQVPTAQLQLFNNIVGKVPLGTRASINLRDSTVDLSGSSLSEKLNRLQLGKLFITLQVNADDEHYLLKELTRLDLRVTNVTFELMFQHFDFPGPVSDTFKRLFQELLTKMTSESQLQELHINRDDSYYRTDVELQFPPSMPGVSTLEFCGGETVISGPTRFPTLRTLIDNSANTTFYPPIVFRTVQKLVAGFEKDRYRHTERSTAVALSQAERWSIWYPNLTILHVCIISGKEDILKTIFTTLTNLEELKVKFEIDRRLDFFDAPMSLTEAADLAKIWNFWTGGVNPVMDDNTAPDVVIPPGVVPRYNAESQFNVDTQNPSIHNLRNLTVLHLLGAPTCLYCALVHLTAIGKMKPLKKLKFQSSSLFSIIFSTMNCHSQYLDILESVHAVVRLSLENSNWIPDEYTELFE